MRQDQERSGGKEGKTGVYGEVTMTKVCYTHVCENTMKLTVLCDECMLTVLFTI